MIRAAGHGIGSPRHSANSRSRSGTGLANKRPGHTRRRRAISGVLVLLYIPARGGVEQGPGTLP
jgi:hypothetical protein